MGSCHGHGKSTEVHHELYQIGVSVSAQRAQVTPWVLGLAKPKRFFFEEHGPPKQVQQIRYRRCSFAHQIPPYGAPIATYQKTHTRMYKSLIIGNMTFLVPAH